jgi:hypothetical protein
VSETSVSQHERLFLEAQSTHVYNPCVLAFVKGLICASNAVARPADQSEVGLR